MSRKSKWLVPHLNTNICKAPKPQYNPQSFFSRVILKTTEMGLNLPSLVSHCPKESIMIMRFYVLTPFCTSKDWICMQRRLHGHTYLGVELLQLANTLRRPIHESKGTYESHSNIHPLQILLCHIQDLDITRHKSIFIVSGT